VVGHVEGGEAGVGVGGEVGAALRVEGGAVALEVGDLPQAGEGARDGQAGGELGQQVGEGHFPGLADVPTHAITLTIPTLLAATRVQVVVPEARKAEAVRRALHEPIDEACPASVLRRVPHATLYLDRDAAGAL
jgi:hypothetical protein